MKSDILGFDYEPIQGQMLKGVFGRTPLTLDDGSVAFDEIKLRLENCSILMSVDSDTDEISCCLETNQKLSHETWVNVDALGGYIGCQIGWLWLSRNWLGYTDMLSISFSGVDPNVTLIAIASKLNILMLQRVK